MMMNHSYWSWRHTLYCTGDQRSAHICKPSHSIFVNRSSGNISAQFLSCRLRHSVDGWVVSGLGWPTKAVVTEPRVSILVPNQSNRHSTLHFQTPNSLSSRPSWSLKRPSNMALLLSHNVYCACVKCVGHACVECVWPSFTPSPPPLSVGRHAYRQLWPDWPKNVCVARVGWEGDIEAVSAETLHVHTV